MRISSINSAGSYRLTSQNIIKQNKRSGQYVQPEVSFQGGKTAAGLGMFGALFGFALGGPLGAAILGGVAAGMGAGADDNKYETDQYGLPTESGNHADEALGVSGWETY